MNIDEDNEKIDLSDHNMIEANFLVTTKKKDKMSELVQREYYKFEEGDMDEYLVYVKRKILESGVIDLNLNIMNRFIHEAAEKILKRTYRRRKNENQEVEAPWITEEIRKEIKLEKVFNRKLYKRLYNRI